MHLEETSLKDLYLIEPKIHKDERGYFMESFKDVFFKQHLSLNFIQDNESQSKYGVLRGLHCQLPPHEQTKLVRVIAGEILDVAVDVRKNSVTYGEYYSVKLNEGNKKQLLIPKGFLHGFVVLSHSAIVQYKVDNHYSPSNDAGVIIMIQTLKSTGRNLMIPLYLKDSNLPKLSNSTALSNFKIPHHYQLLLALNYKCIFSDFNEIVTNCII